ncbi:uncharacterized protein MICPUCDRAFT_54960 [Micromonas pusilla CCMP1545]|uniref:Predicted protein n=1 Tax=Micromonas pusilla (strain CCMP1545) TaxID=564608 RepID=C1NAL1_MICPC|nr:uncharacterized protein MICPUCDRAFT_54960 [Micromonas pusilla CCMP1545]EEH50961.1 predicted protein [Micromonas pusilla CCMP1545]|eukprot:XP_003064981.1 predicted protein [Micromonas pusilla CCMP1545]
MKSTFSCKTSDGTSCSVTAANCVGHVSEVLAWHDASRCFEFEESTFPCKLSDGSIQADRQNYDDGGANVGALIIYCYGGLNTYATCQGTIKTPVNFESCTGFVNENLISIRIAQALAYSSTLISILSAVYEFFAKRELRKQARERAENGDDAQITLDIEAAPAQIALLQLEVGTQKKTIDILKKAFDASKKAFQKQVDELRQLLMSRRRAPSILPV